MFINKISSYVDDSMPLPSPKDVLILNDELIDNYTGNGITPHGSVKIDENSIASGFSNSNNFILTSLNCLSLNDGFEFQVKAKNNDDSLTIFCESTLDGDPDVCLYIALCNHHSDIGGLEWTSLWHRIFLWYYS